MVNGIKNTCAKYSYGLVPVLSIVAIISGGLIYILFRPSKYLFFEWIDAPGLGGLLDAARNTPFTQDLNLPQWIIYSLPNGLWAFAYALIITHIWSGGKSWLRIIWIISIPVLVLGYEFLQYTHIVQGSFCAQDVLTGILGLFLGTIIGNKNN